MGEQTNGSGSRALGALLVALLLGALAPGEAPAATAAVEGSALVYAADPGEHNRLTVEPVEANGVYRLRDDVAIRPGSGCRSDGNEVVCDAAGVVLVRIDVGDRDDRAQGPDAFLVEPLRVEMRGGDGDDALASGIYADNLQEGGPGNDTLAAGDSAFVLRGGDGDDRLMSGIDGAGSLDGGAGDDYFEPQSTRATIAGGPGLDALSYRYSCCEPAGPAIVTLDGIANDGGNGPAGYVDNVGSDIEVISGSTNGDSFTGDAGANSFHGLEGADTLAGGAGDDYLYGEAGDDRLTGGAGSDQLDGGRGDDTLDSRDGALDSVVCGPGLDSVIGDRSDAVAGDCERRELAPAPLVQAQPATAGAATTVVGAGGVAGAVARAPRVSVEQRATLRAGVLRLRLRCAASARTLTGTVALRTRIGGPSRSLGRARFRCRAGARAVAALRLRAGQRRLLASARRVRLSLTISTSSPGGSSTRTTAKAILVGG